MKLYSLASSSTANAYIYDFGGTLIGVDLGLNRLNYLKKLDSANIEYQNIAEFFISHEHTDHVKGLKVIQKANDTCINLSQGTFDALNYEVLKKNIITKNSTKEVGNVIVEVINVSHDAKEPLGFIFYYNEQKYVHLLDAGYISQNLQQKLANAVFYLIESNYEEEMLITNPNYPLSIKKRILSDRGHLSNQQCNQHLQAMIGPKTNTICFGHLSPKNNDPRLVLELNQNLDVPKKVVLSMVETTVVECK